MSLKSFVLSVKETQSLRCLWNDWFICTYRVHSITCVMWDEWVTSHIVYVLTSRCLWNDLCILYEELYRYDVSEMTRAFCQRNSIIMISLKWLIHPRISRTLCHLCDVRRMTHVTHSVRDNITMSLKWPGHSVQETLWPRCLWNDSFIRLKCLIYPHISRTLHHLCDVTQMSHATRMLTMSLKGLVHSVRETLSLRCLWNDSFIPHISRTLRMWCERNESCHT